MDVVSLCPLRASGFVWQSQDGRYAQTVVVKATFALAPGRASLVPSEAQEAPNEDDAYWNDDPARSVVAPSDRVPYKPRADVMLVGHAYSPGKQPLRSVLVRMVVGELDKAIEVWCDRGFRLQDGRLLEGQRFTRMPLRWERAAGGPETNNPVGMRFDAAPDAYGIVPIPNLQPPRMLVTKRSDTFAPVCFGPVAASWPGRTQRLGRLAGSFPQPGWEERPMPEGLDFAYFQAAPPDQQVTEIRPNERIVLENLHPEHARLVTSLPDVRPRAIANRATGEREEVALVADTLWIDTDRGLCVVVWRGRIGLRHAGEAGQIAVTAEGIEAEELGDDMLQTSPPLTEDAGKPEKEEDTGVLGVTLVPQHGRAAVTPVMPFVAANQPPAAAPAPRPADGILPFGQPGGGERKPSTPGMPAVVPPSTPPPPLAAPPPIASPKYPPRPQPLAAPRPAPESVWAAGPPIAAGPQRETIGAAAAAAAAVAVAAPSVDRASQEGATAASNAAAGAAPWSVPKRELRPVAAESEPLRAEPARELLQLLWYDADSVTRMRRVPAWKKVFEDFERNPRSRALEFEEGAREQWEAEDRQEVFEVLAKAPRTEGKGVDEALEAAIGEDGRFIPPPLLLAGELEMPFDELEALKAAMSTAAPLVMPADEGLKSAVAVAKEFLQTPGLSASPAVSEGLTARLREAFAREKKALPADYLEQQMERVLLSGRHYQKREVFGGRFLRCLLWLPGEQHAIVGYVPEEVGKKLPMYRRFRARVVGELWPGQDQYEAIPRAVKVLAVGRVGAGTRRG